MTATVERQLRAPLPPGGEPGLRLCFGMIKVKGARMATGQRHPSQLICHEHGLMNAAGPAQDLVREGHGAGGHRPAADHHRGK